MGDLQTGYALADKHPQLFRVAIRIEAFMWKRVDGIIAISKPFKNFIVKQGIADNKVKIVKESINLEGVDFNTTDVKRTGVIMFHGALSSCKGLETLVDSFRMLKRKYPETSLIIAGGGGEEKKIKNYIEKWEVENVILTGWYNFKKLEELMKNVQISVAMRSQNIANNFVVTTCLLENWVYKKPVIAPSLDAFSIEVEDGVNGILFKVGDAKDLYEKLVHLYENPKLYDGLIRNGLKSASEVFDHKKIANDMVNTLLYFIISCQVGSKSAIVVTKIY